MFLRTYMRSCRCARSLLALGLSIALPLVVAGNAHGGVLSFSSASVSGTNLVMTGTGGVPGATFYTMASTNVALGPAALWNRIRTNSFASDGSFSNSIPLDLTRPQYCVLLATTTPAPIPGLVAAFAFDEGTGSTCADSSTNKITGTIHGAAWTTAGYYGDALSFDGSTTYVDLGNPSPLKITGSMTIEAWVSEAEFPPDDGQIVAKSDSNAPLIGWQFKTSQDTGVRTFAISVSPGGSSLVQRYSSTVIALNTWYHVAGVYNAPAGTLDIYVNGVLDDGMLRGGTVPNSQFDPVENVLVGKRASGWFFGGSIDEVRVYNVPLTQAQIQSDMTTTVGNTTTVPGNLTATSSSASDVNLQWSSPVAKLGLGAFLVERQNPGSSNFVQIAATVSPTYADHGLTANATYNYRVRAVDRAGDAGPYSSVAAVSASFSIAPRRVVLVQGNLEQFTPNFTNAGTNWAVDGLPGGSLSAGTITASGLYSPPATAGSHIVSVSTIDLSQSNYATVYVATNPGVLTYHNDNLRTGLNFSETVLSPANVNTGQFGKLFSYPLDGVTFAEPLYLPNVAIAGEGTHNVVFVATEHDSVYALDADGLTNAPLWKVSFISPTNGIKPIPAIQAAPSDPNYTEFGVTGTPVIDPVTGTIYAVADTLETVGLSSNFVQRLHALDIGSGAEKFGGPVLLQGSEPGTGDGSQGGVIAFDPRHGNQRPALLLSGGAVYICFGSHGEEPPFHGWLLGYNATNLQRTLVYCSTPNGSDGGIWHAGGGPAADTNGFVYVVTGNGTFDANTGGTNYGDSLEKISPAGVVGDYFTPHDQANMDANDLDLSSGGILLLPDQPGPIPHLAISCGKTGTIYLLNRENMGHYNPNNDNQIVQSLVNALPGGGPDTGSYTPPVYFNGQIYFGAVDDTVRAFSISNGVLSSSPRSMASATYPYPGPALSVSGSGNTNGVVWAMQYNGLDTPGILHAYDALNLTNELYNTTQAGSRDTLNAITKFNPPMIANGRVYIASQSQLTVFGLLP